MQQQQSEEDHCSQANVDVNHARFKVLKELSKFALDQAGH